MKRFLILVLSIMVVLCFVACKNDKQADNSTLYEPSQTEDTQKQTESGNPSDSDVTTIPSEETQPTTQPSELEEETVPSEETQEPAGPSEPEEETAPSEETQEPADPSEPEEDTAPSEETEESTVPSEPEAPTPPEHIHSFSDATCTQPEICETCGETKGTALGHTYSDATCTQPRICKICGEVNGKALGHAYSDATCTQPRICKTCGAPTGAPLGHAYSDATCTAPRICKNCGGYSGAALGHTYSDATCTQPQICKTCGVTNGAALGHTYSDATCTQPRTCKTCGVTSGSALGHSYSDATCIKPQTCIHCGITKGTTVAHHYVQGECTGCNDYSASYCPKLYFTGDMSEMTSKSDVRNITFEYRSRQQILSGAAKIKVQGSSSLAYDKKNYTINFYKDSGYSSKMGLDVGWGKQNKYCLKANWIDKTHARNIVTAKLAGEMQRKYGLFNMAPNNGAVDGFPIEIYINGEFHGLYTMNIPKDAWMFGMDEDNPNHIVIGGENWNDPVLFKEIPADFSDWSVEIGSESEETLAKIQRLVAFVRDSSDDEFRKNFGQYLDLDSTLNYYVMMHYCWMQDNWGKNMLLATYDGNVWYPSLYDLDTTWGTHWSGTKLYDYENALLSATKSILWDKMERLFKEEIAQRYFELRSTILDPEYVMDKFYEFQSLIPQEVLARETAKWDTEETPIPGYSISQIQEYLDCVIPRLDAQFRQWMQETTKSVVVYSARVQSDAPAGLGKKSWIVDVK